MSNKLNKNMKAKLKRRGYEIYNKYFFNNPNILEEIINQIDTIGYVDESICSVVFNVSEKYKDNIYELISLYPNKLKEKKYIDDDYIIEMYSIYSETIDIIKNNKSYLNPRGKIIDRVRNRAKEFNIPFNISSEDIILKKVCPILKFELKYDNITSDKFSPSLDRIDPNLGYTKGNIEIISMLANSMKSNANVDELITFSNSILERYK